MTKISYEVNGIESVITWAAAEQFGELVGQTFYLRKMEATEIEKIQDISVVAKILLSAVAGAVIQRLLDSNVEAEAIFADGQFRVERMDD